ncbi:MAG: cbb3-type cytochrome oxidase assembly protein CcoS [Burkholderiaceae bacterium]|nr:cbb3-type cytochrome oxidase assembly protein CcoS [Burkholderiaceae bacterium]
MEALYLLIPLSLLAVAAALWLFLRMSDSGQFDDLESPGHRILLDNDRHEAGAPEPSEDGAGKQPLAVPREQAESRLS